MENILFKTNDPAKMCQAVIHSGHQQCFYEKVEGSNYCHLHGGIHAQKKLEQQKIRNYRLQLWRDRVNEFSDNDAVKSLREEIGILRLTLESVVNRCKDEDDLLLYSHKIADLAMRIDKLVNSCHKLESSLGFLMDKTTVLNISKQMIQIVSLHVNSESILDKIAESFTQLFSDPSEAFHRIEPMIEDNRSISDEQLINDPMLIENN